MDKESDTKLYCKLCIPQIAACDEPDNTNMGRQCTGKVHLLCLTAHCTVSASLEPLLGLLHVCCRSDSAHLRIDDTNARPTGCVKKADVQNSVALIRDFEAA